MSERYFPTDMDSVSEFYQIVKNKVSSKRAIDLLDGIFMNDILKFEILNAKHKKNVRNIILSNLYVELNKPKIKNQLPIEVYNELITIFNKYIDEIFFLVGKAPKIY